MKKAFTLAEVLVTLGIIGVVSAMTVPSLMQIIREKLMLHSYIKYITSYSRQACNI